MGLWSCIGSESADTRTTSLASFRAYGKNDCGSGKGDVHAQATGGCGAGLETVEGTAAQPGNMASNSEFSEADGYLCRF